MSLCAEGIGRLARLAVCAAAAQALGCGPASPSEGLQQIQEPQYGDIVRCGEQRLLNPDGTVRVVKLWFAPRAMNDKLRYFPDLAARTGLQSVSSCEDAQLVVRTYAEYRDENPGFDEFQPEAEVICPRGTTPMPAGGGTVPQIQSGTANPMSSVVKISFLDTLGQLANPNEIGSCTGTFISKHWIATAAHCMFQGNPPNPTTVGIQDTKVTIDFAQSDGTPDPSRSVTTFVQQFPDGKYMAYMPPWGGGLPVDVDFDFALLYVPPDNDPNLFPNADDDDAVGPAMRLFLDTQAAVAQSPLSLGMIGWGRPMFKEMSGNAEFLDPYTVQGSRIVSKAVDANFAASNLPSPCKGDSGGPLFKMVRVAGKDRPTIVGVMRAVSGTDAAQACPRAAGDRYIWTSVKPEREFIDRAMRCYNGGGDLNANGGFRCTPVADDAGTALNMLQCWGAPCQSMAAPGNPLECRAGTYCSHPASDFAGQNCKACNNNGCACILGECLPNH